MFYATFTLEMWHGIKHHLIKKEDEGLVSHFCKQKLSRTRLPGWENGKATDREKKLGVCVCPAPQAATCWMQFLSWASLATYFSLWAGWGAPCVQNTARINKWKELSTGMLERRKSISKPPLLDSVLVLGSLLSLLLVNSGTGLVPFLKGQHGDKLSSLWSPWC